MAEPNFAALEMAEAVAVRAALERGYLSPEQLRHALLIREQLRAASRPVQLLQLLGRTISPEHQQDLRSVYYEALGRAESGASPPPPTAPAGRGVQELLSSSDDELAIPEFILSQSREQLARPPEHDPQPVQDFLVKSAEGLPEELPEVEDDPSVTDSGLWRWLKRNLPGKG